MYLPPIESNCNYEPFVSGDVTIAPDAAIAPGAIVQAAPNSRIVIASGVCIGMGAIIHAYNGNIEIEEGVTIGAGVLVVGRAKIAARACIGALTTIMSLDIEARQVVAAGSILGDTSREVSESSPPASIPIPIPTKTEAIPVGAAATPTNAEVAEAIPSGAAATPTNAEVAEAIPSGATSSITNAEEAEQAKAEQSQYVSPGNRYNTFIQPKPISIPETETSTNIEEEEKQEATTSVKAEESEETAEEQSQYAAPGPRYHTFIQPKPVSIPEATTTTNINNGAILPAAEATAPESEEEEKNQAPKNPVAGLDYVRGMMKTLFPHQNISLSSEDDED